MRSRLDEENRYRNPDVQRVPNKINTKKPIPRHIIINTPKVKQKENLKSSKRRDQDGGIGRHTAPLCTTRTDRKSNGKEVRHQVDKKKETFIQTGRRGGDGHRDGEDTHCRGGTETGGVWDKWGRQSDH